MDGYVAHNRACDKHGRYHNEHRAKLSTLSGHPTIGVANILWSNVAIERRSGNSLLSLRNSIIGSHNGNHYNIYKVVDLQVISKKIQNKWTHDTLPKDNDTINKSRCSQADACLPKRHHLPAHQSVLRPRCNLAVPLLYRYFICTCSTQVRGLFIGWAGDKLFRKPSKRKIEK